MDLDFEKQFFYNTKAMRITFCHPDIARDKKWMLCFGIVHGLFTVVFFIILYSFVYHDLKTMNFSRLCTDGIYLLIFIVITAQYTIMLLYQDVLQKIIAIMMEDYNSSKSLPNEEQKIVLKYANKGTWITRQWVTIAVCGLTVFTLKSIILTIYYAFTDEFRFMPFLYLSYPEFIEKRKDNVFVFVFIMYLPQMHYSVYCALMYLAFVPLGPIFVFHACGQLELVKIRIGRLYKGRSPQQVREELRAIAERLQFIYSFTEYIKSCFLVMYELSMKGSTIMLPITFYEIVESFHRREVNLELFAFLFGATLISSSPCYCSDLLMDKSEAVRMALYMCGWERKCDRSIRSMLGIMLTRALRPNAIQTMFRTVCLEALAELLQQAYAIYNLMNAMWK